MKKISSIGILLGLLFALTSNALAVDPVFNGDFELLPSGVSEETALKAFPLGWVASGKGQKWSMHLTKDQAVSGKYSMQVTVDPDNDPWGVHIASKPIPVTPGRTYTTTMKVFNDVSQAPYDGRVDLYIEFWPEGGWWGETDYWSTENALNKTPGIWAGTKRLSTQIASIASGAWVDVTASAVAPEGAKYVTISFWTSRRVLNSYIDDVQISEE